MPPTLFSIEVDGTVIYGGHQSIFWLLCLSFGAFVFANLFFIANVVSTLARGKKE